MRCAFPLFVVAALVSACSPVPSAAPELTATALTFTPAEGIEAMDPVEGRRAVQEARMVPANWPGEPIVASN